MGKNSKDIQKVDKGLLASFAGEAEQRQQESSSGPRPPYIRIAEKRQGRGAMEAEVRVQYPELRDEAGKPLVKSAQDISGVLLAYLPYRELKYRDDKGNWVTEAFAVGTKRQATAVGSLIGGQMPMTELDEVWDQMDKRRTITNIEGNVETTEIKWTSKIATVWLLDPAFWTSEEEPTLAMAFISNSSFYGNSIEDEEDWELRNHTLRAFPTRGQGDHKGVLLRLNTRPWEFGIEQGIVAPEKGTPTSAIWMHIFGTWLGTPVAVHAFDLGDELSYDELVMVDGVKEQAKELLVDWMASGYRFAFDRLSSQQARQLAEYAYAEQFGELAEYAKKALPVSVKAEPVEDDEPEGGDDFDTPFDTPNPQPVSTSPRTRRTSRPAPVATVIDDGEFDDFDE